MKGIWKNPEATREAFFEGGWLRSGDAGYFDDEGFIYIHDDRVKDMIITSAENVYRPKWRTPCLAIPPSQMLQ